MQMNANTRSRVEMESKIKNIYNTQNLGLPKWNIEKIGSPKLIDKKGVMMDLFLNISLGNKIPIKNWITTLCENL